MLKLVKSVSVSAVLLAAVTVATVVYFMVFGTAAVRKRVDVLNGQSAIEAFRTALASMPESEAQLSPLVEQAHILALRINPPKPPKQIIAEAAQKIARKEPMKEIIKPKTVVNVRSNLLATCMVEDYPEKSLALIDLSAKGHKWVREGDEVGHLTVHKINDGNIVFYQGSKEHSIQNVPERKASSLLKTSAAEVLKNTASEAKGNYVNTASPNDEASSVGQRTRGRNEVRKLPARSTTEQQASTQKTMTAIESMIKETETSSGKGKGKGKRADDSQLWTEVLKMLKKSNEGQEKLKARREKMAREKEKLARENEK